MLRAAAVESSPFGSLTDEKLDGGDMGRRTSSRILVEGRRIGNAAERSCARVKR